MSTPQQDCKVQRAEGQQRHWQKLQEVVPEVLAVTEQ